MRCASCGAENQREGSSCSGCGVRLPDRWAPPLSSLEAGGGTGGEPEPWELKRWRISGLSWAAMWISMFIPPVGLILSFFAIGAANRFRKRPGNRAMAYAALGTALYMGFMWAVVGFTIWSEARRIEDEAALYSLSAPYGDPYAPGPGVDPAAPPTGTSPEEMAELQRLLEQLAQQPAPTE